MLVKVSQTASSKGKIKLAQMPTLFPEPPEGLLAVLHSCAHSFLLPTGLLVHQPPSYTWLLGVMFPYYSKN